MSGSSELGDLLTTLVKTFSEYLIANPQELDNYERGKKLVSGIRQRAREIFDWLPYEHGSILSMSNIPELEPIPEAEPIPKLEPIPEAEPICEPEPIPEAEPIPKLEPISKSIPVVAINKSSCGSTTEPSSGAVKRTRRRRSGEVAQSGGSQPKKPKSGQSSKKSNDDTSIEGAMVLRSDTIQASTNSSSNSSSGTDPKTSNQVKKRGRPKGSKKKPAANLNTASGSSQNVPTNDPAPTVNPDENVAGLSNGNAVHSEPILFECTICGKKTEEPHENWHGKSN